MAGPADNGPGKQKIFLPSSTWFASVALRAELQAPSYVQGQGAQGATFIQPSPHRQPQRNIELPPGQQCGRREMLSTGRTPSLRNSRPSHMTQPLPSISEERPSISGVVAAGSAPAQPSGRNGQQPALGAAWRGLNCGPPSEDHFLTCSGVRSRGDACGPQIHDRFLASKRQLEHHTDGRCSAPGRSGLPEKRSLSEALEFGLGQSVSGTTGQRSSLPAHGQDNEVSPRCEISRHSNANPNLSFGR